MKASLKVQTTAKTLSKPHDTEIFNCSFTKFQITSFVFQCSAVPIGSYSINNLVKQEGNNGRPFRTHRFPQH